MIARAAPRTLPARGQRASQSRFLRFLILITGVACLCSASTAAAEVGTAVSIFNDARFRGYSISNGHPVALLDISYDGPGGLYAAASASVFARSRGALRPLALQVNGGYATRLPSGVTVDIGVVHTNYARYSSTGSGKSYTEVYAGLAGKFVSSRVYFSPNYLKAGVRTLYGEVDGSISPASKLRLEGHIGMLALLDHTENGDYARSGLDWRLGISRSIGRVSLHAAWTGRGSGRDVYESRTRGGNALTFGLSCVL